MTTTRTEPGTAEVHITYDGIYALCPLAPASCPEVHLPGIHSLAEAFELPRLFLEQLLDAVDDARMAIFSPGIFLEDPLGAGRWQTETEVRIWGDRNFAQRHRGYDLPALVETGRLSVWYRYGQIHRENDLPALINTQDDLRIWMQHGKYHRTGGQPAIINGYQHDWFEYGRRTRPSLIIVPGRTPFEVTPPRSLD